MKCTPQSLLFSMMTAAELGLDVGGVLGQAYLVPFWNRKANGGKGGYEAQFIPGYKGLINLARRSGKISLVESRLVRQGDTFELEFGLHPKVVHVPNYKSSLGDVLGAYCIARVTGEDPLVEWMTRSDLDGIKARSKSRDRDGNIVGPWITDEAQMQRKTVIRRTMNYVPMSPELERAIEIGDQAEYADAMPSFESDENIAIGESDAEQSEEPTRTSVLKDKLKGDGEDVLFEKPRTIAMGAGPE